MLQKAYGASLGMNPDTIMSLLFKSASVWDQQNYLEFGILILWEKKKVVL